MLAKNTDAQGLVRTPADLAYLESILCFSRSFFGAHPILAGRKDVLYTLELVVAEACTNVMRHAYEERHTEDVEVRLHIAPPRFILDVTDTGAHFDPTTVPDPDLDTPGEGGYGLFILRQNADVFEYSRANGLNTMHIEMEIDS